MRNHILAFASLAALTLFVPACGSDDTSSGGGPTVLAVTPDVTDNGDGTFTVDLTVTFDDSLSGDLVDAYTFDTADGQVNMNDVPLPTPSASPITIAGIILPADENGQASLAFHLTLYGENSGIGADYDGTINVN